MKDTSAEQTGFCSCTYNEPLSSNDLVTSSFCHHPRSSVYVFVNDPKLLFVPQPGGNDVAFLQVVQFQPVTIPCRTTSSKVNVSLLKTNKETGQVAHVRIGPGSHYDPIRGFYFRRFRWDPENAGLMCRGRLNNVVDEYEVSIILSRNTGPLFPIIDDNNATYVLVNSSFSMDCSVVIDAGISIVSINWDHPLGNSERAVIGSIRSNHVPENSEHGDQLRIVSRRIAVVNAQPSDEGKYECIVISSNGKSFTASHFVVVENRILIAGIRTRERYSRSRGSAKIPNLNPNFVFISSICCFILTLLHN